jgi:hypothetical protein
LLAAPGPMAVANTTRTRKKLRRRGSELLPHDVWEWF